MKVVDGEPRDFGQHAVRLARSLAELRISAPTSDAVLRHIVAETVRRNRIPRAIVYVQITRGIAPRNHLFPKTGRASLAVTVRPAPFPSSAELAAGCGVVSVPDQRWDRCDIKSISLLANVMAKQAAAEKGCREAWLIDEDGNVTEGSSSNAYIIDGEGRLVTRPLGESILGGVTRIAVLEIARKAGIPVVERPFSLEEAHAAREAFLTSTTSLVMPVVRIDERTIANGVPGSVTRRIQELYCRAQGLHVLCEPQAG